MPVIRRIAALVLIAVIAGCGGGSSLTAGDKTACQSAVSDANAEVRQQEIDMSTSDWAAIKTDEQVVSGEITNDAGSADSPKLKAAMNGWATAYADAANLGPLNQKGLAGVTAAFNKVAAICPK